MPYLDHNASSPLRPEALAAMRPVLEQGAANPSSLHRQGRAARKALEGARERLAGLLGTHPEGVVFTSGGTEAANLCVLGAALASPKGRRAACSAVEHPAVLQAVHGLASFGGQGRILPVDPLGRCAPEALRAAGAGELALVSVMHANNETGVVNDIAALGAWCRDHGVLFHSDAAQSFGKLPVDLARQGLDLVSASGHKFGGPQGSGFVALRPGLRLVPQLLGGDQEGELRPGTENLAAALGMVAAAEAAHAQRDAEGRRLAGLRDRLQGLLRAGIPSLEVHGEGAERVPGTLYCHVPGFMADTLLMALDQAGVAASAGAACAAGAAKPSHVLLAMGKGEACAQGSLRFSFGWDSAERDPELAAEALIRAVAELGRTRL